MTLSFHEIVRSGGTQLAGLYYIAGMPWAVTTHPALISNITAAYRKKLFGNATIDSGATYASDLVQVLPGLDPDFGAQSVRYSEDGGLQQDSWSVTFDRQGDVADFTSYFADAKQGLLGLDIMPDIDHAGVYKATLTSSWTSTTAASQFTASFSEEFEDWFDAKITAEDWPILWVGNQALYCSARSGSTISAKNCLYTKYSYIPRGDTSNERVRATSVPLNGLVGFNSYLYLIEIEEDGTIANPDAMPIIYRSGRVATNSLSSHGQWTISNDSWVSLLDQTLPVSTFNARLKGYMLTRPSDGTLAQFSWPFGAFWGNDSAIGLPHLVLMEDPATWVLDTAGISDGHWTAPTISPIWLCAPGDYVYFGSIEEINQAMADELYKINEGTSTLNSSVTPLYTYKMTELGPKWFSASTAGFVFAAGPLPFICGWGWTTTKFVEEYRTRFDTLYFKRPYVALSCSYSEQLLPYGPEISNIDQWWGYFSNHRPTFFDGTSDDFPDKLATFENTCEYWYDWALDDDTIAEQFLNSEGAIPIANNRVYVESDDLSEIEEDLILSIGYVYNDPANYGDELNQESLPRALYCKALSTTFDNTENRNYITLKPDSTYTDAASTTVAKWRSGGIRQGIYYPARIGRAIYFHPDVHEQDPWEIHFYSETISSKLSDIYKIILAQTVTGKVQIQRQYSLMNIPETADYSSLSYSDNMGRGLIDFDTLDRYSEGSIPGALYKYVVGARSSGTDQNKDQSFLKQLTASLTTHRIQPAWEYCEAKRAWWMTFTELGVDNVTDAALSGRIYTASDFEHGGNMPVTVGDTYIVSEIKYESKLRKNLFPTQTGLPPRWNESDLEIRKKSPYKVQTRGTKSLTIEDRIIYPAPESVFYIDRNIAQILLRLSRVSDVQTVPCVPSTVTKIAVGKEILLSGTQVRDHNTGEYGASDITAKIIGCDMSLEHPIIKIRINNRPMRAISPSLYIDYSKMATSETPKEILVTGLYTDPIYNQFEPTTSGMTDLARFDCLYFDNATNSVEPCDCDCDDYRIILLKRNQSDMAELSEYWVGTISDVNVTAGSCTITLDDDTGLDVESGYYVIFFAPYDDADLQPHQKIWAWFGDSSGRVTDSEGVSRIGAVIA